MTGEFFAAPDVSMRAVGDFFHKRTQNGENIQAVQVYVDNKLKLRFAPHPYSCTQAKEVNSLSKSFTAAAIGVLYDKGLLSPDEYIVDLFPDKLPQTVSSNLKQMQIKHLLTMTTGHEKCVMEKMYSASDAAKAFLAQEVQYKPGTHFLYNTGASCMLAEIVQKKTGRKLFDFARQALFDPLGIKNVMWTQCAQGVNEGGIGLHISNDDIAKFGLMLYNKGIWNGKRILSEDWCEQMGAAQVDNTINGDSGSGNWTSGYGYQCWRTKKDGYRGDGASGQLCMIMPKNKAVVAINARTIDMEKEIVDAVELVENLFGSEPAQYEITDYPTLPIGTLPDFCKNTYAALEPNPSGFTELHIESKDDAVILELSDGAEKKTITAGLGRWCESKFDAIGRTPKLLGLRDPYTFEHICLAACAGEENGALKILFRHLSVPYSETVTIQADASHIRLDFFCIQDMLADDCTKLQGKIL